MIHAYYVSEVSSGDGLIFGTNHGSDPYEGNVAIRIRDIVAASTRHVGTHNVQHRCSYGSTSSDRLIGATDDTWVCDFWLVNGDHIWLYDATFDAANDGFDNWLAAVTP